MESRRRVALAGLRPEAENHETREQRTYDQDQKAPDHLDKPRGIRLLAD